MLEEDKRWFIEKVAQHPEYLADTYLPMLESLVKRAEVALDQAIRKEGIEKIKYQMGWLDGVRETCALLGGLRISERKKSPEPGLMARILSMGRT